MRIIKRFLILVLLLVIVFSGLIWADNKGYFNKPALQKISQLTKKIPFQNLTTNIKSPKLEKLDNEMINKISQDVEEQAQILGQRAKETSGHVQQVLGESIKVNEAGEKKPLSSQALEYGRYLYCQTVIEDWEKNHPVEE